MPRSVVALKFNVGALMPGRVVKTQTYTRSTLSHFRDCNLNHQAEIQQWCNLKFRIKSADLRRRVVTLVYGNPSSSTILPEVEWPMDCLNQEFGIKIN